MAINDPALAAILTELRDLRKVSNAASIIGAEESNKLVKEALSKFTAELDKFTVGIGKVTTHLNENDEQIKTLFTEKTVGPLNEQMTALKAEFASITSGKELTKFIDKIKASGADYDVGLSKLLKKRELIENAKLKLEEKQNISAKERIKQQGIFEKMLRHHEHSIDNFFSKLGVQTFNNESNPSSLYDALNQKRGGGPNANEGLKFYFTSQTAIIKKTLDPLNLVLNLLSNFKTQTVALMSELDTQTVAFYKATGQIGNYGDAIAKSWGNVRTANVSLADMSQQFIKLFDSVRTFTTLSQASQESLAEYGSLAERLGADIGKPLSFFMDSLQQSDVQAKSSLSSLLGIAKTTGESLSKITKDFTSSLSSLAVYGNRAKDVFRDLFATAKSLKLETSALLAITKGYDTFEEAATKVGRLNAVLGGPYLNTLQMMQQSEGDRVKSLYQAVKATGMSWNALSKYQRLAIASAAGINDMNDANAIFSGSLADVAKYSRKAAMEQDELAERNKRAATLQQKWQNLLSQLSVVLMPVLDALHSIVSVLTDVMSLPVIKWILPIVAGFYLLKTAGVALFAPFKQLFGFFKGVVGKKGEGLSGALENTAAAANKANAPVAKAGGVFSKFGNVMMSIGRGVSASFTAIGQGISNFAGAIAKNAGQIVIAAGAIAAAILLIGGAIQLVIGLGKSLSSSPTEQLTKLTDSIGKSGPNFADNMKTTAESLGKLTENFNKVKTANVTSFVNLFDTLKKYSDSFNVEGIGFINAYSAFMGNIADITPEKVTNVSQITENIVKMSQDVQDGKSINLLLEKLTTLIGAGKSTATASDNNTKIHLTIKLADGTSIRKELDNYGTIGI